MINVVESRFQFNLIWQHNFLICGPASWPVGIDSDSCSRSMALALSLSGCVWRVSRAVPARVPRAVASPRVSPSRAAQSQSHSRAQAQVSAAVAMFIAEERGAANSPDYRVYISEY